MNLPPQRSAHCSPMLQWGQEQPDQWSPSSRTLERVERVEGESSSSLELRSRPHHVGGGRKQRGRNPGPGHGYGHSGSPHDLSRRVMTAPQRGASNSSPAGRRGLRDYPQSSVSMTRLPPSSPLQRRDEARQQGRHGLVPVADTWESDVLGGRQRTREASEDQRMGQPYVLRPETAKAMALRGALPAVSWKAWFGEKKVSSFIGGGSSS